VAVRPRKLTRPPNQESRAAATPLSPLRGFYSNVIHFWIHGLRPWLHAAAARAAL